MKKGLALLEVIVAASVALILGTAAVVSWGKIEVWRLERKTAEKLERFTQCFLDYFEQNGSFPELDALSSFCGLSPADFWGKPLLYGTSVEDQSSREVYPAVFISSGSDGVFQSLLQGNAVSLSEKDIYRIVSQTELSSLGRSLTKQKVRRANAALELYLQTSSSPDPACLTEGSKSCPSVLVAQSYLEGSDGYDAWGNPLVIWNSQLISPGPDGTAGSSDDVLP